MEESNALILNHINTTANRNKETIERIKTKDKLHIHHYNIHTRCGGEGLVTLDAKQITKELSAKEIILKWEFEGQLVQVPDTFNDNLDFTCSSFADCVRLNTTLTSIANKYDLFGESSKVKQIILVLKNNLLLLQLNLTTLEGLLEDQTSVIPQIGQELKEINLKLASLQARQNVSFSFSPPLIPVLPQGPSPSILLSNDTYWKINQRIENAQPWQLIYQGSKHGFNTEDFYKNCTGKGPTITVIKVEETGRVFGGFTTIPWVDTGKFKADAEAFLFCQNNDHHTSRFFGISNKSYAVYHSPGRGIDFGGGDALCLRRGEKFKNGWCGIDVRAYKADDGGKYTNTTLAGLSNFTVAEV